MSRADPYNLRSVITRLNNRGVQLWHNRGRLYAGPLALLDAADQALLAAARDDLIALLKSEPQCALCPESLIAPCPPSAGSYAGRTIRKPWDYEVAVVLPHFRTPDLLEAAIACWRHQTVSPYLLVIDTGTKYEGAAAVEALRGYDLEVHSIRGHAWRHSSSPVAAALDLAFALCQQRYALLTHVDVFPRRQTLLEELISRMTLSCPVLGYQMSKRVGSAEWQQCVSHTLTLVDLQAMRRHRLTWNLLAALEADDEVEQRYLGWPDTETWFGRGLRAAGIVPEFLGPESNASVYATDLIVHWRSAPSVRHYLPDQVGVRHPGLFAWLRETRQLGVAAPLPATSPASVAGERS
jgi:hypothetical protein